MKLKFLIIAFTLISGIINANTNTNIDLRNRTPFDDNNTDGPKIEYHKFGEKRNINVKSASYNHYNQRGHKQSIINQNNISLNRTQNVTLQNNQFNYNNQNNSRKNHETAVTAVRYNTPMQIDQYRGSSLSSTVASNNIVIETGLTQHVGISEDSEAETPEDATEDPNEGPLTDTIPFMLFLATIYYTILRYKK